MQNLLPAVRDLDHRLNQERTLTEEIVLKIVSSEEKLKIINDLFENFENSSATHFTEISEGVKNVFNQSLIAQDNYLKNFQEVHKSFIQKLTDLQQKAELVPSTLETIKSDSLALSNTVKNIQQEISQLNTKYIDDCDKMNQLLLDVSIISTSQRKSENFIQEIQHNLLENNGISKNLQNLLSAVRDLDQHLNQERTLTEETVLKLISSEEKLKIINDRFENFENSSATHFTEISEGVMNGFNQSLIAQDNYLKNFQEIHNSLKSDIATNQESVERLLHLYEDTKTILTKELDAISTKLTNQDRAIQEINSLYLYDDNLTILSKEIDTKLAKLENQNRAIQEINSTYQEDISRRDIVNNRVQRQNTILIVIVVFFAALSVFIAVALK
ncbi:MAG: hypothetical protein PHR06_13795 [Candidatus Cloacimonetes bacterium]|nr:hypothetical protein [Candidatus Cloacimonadota bacterium]